jgi:ATP-dependent Clp protease ATP-binding subunit ClpA
VRRQGEIIDVQLERLRKTLEERGITIELDDTAAGGMTAIIRMRIAT